MKAYKSVQALCVYVRMDSSRQEKRAAAKGKPSTLKGLQDDVVKPD